MIINKDARRWGVQLHASIKYQRSLDPLTPCPLYPFDFAQPFPYKRIGKPVSKR